MANSPRHRPNEQQQSPNNNNNATAAVGAAAAAAEGASKTTAITPATASLVVKNTCLAPGDLKRQARESYNSNSIIKTGESSASSPSSSLRALSLKYCYVDFIKKKAHEPKLLQELVDLLEKNLQLESLELQGLFPRNQDDVLQIVTALRNHHHLASIYISVPEESRVPFSLKSWVSIFKNNSTTLVKLHLESFDLTDIHASIESTLIPCLSSIVSLRHVQLGSCRITDKGLWKLVRGLDYMKRVQHLQLPLCSTLTPLSLLTMANLLQMNTELHVLDLMGNAGLFAEPQAPEEQDESLTSAASYAKACLQREQGLSAFLRSLQNNTTLLELNLSYCGMTDGVFKFLLASLERNRKLATLNVNYNQLTTKIGLHTLLREIMPKLRALSNLHLHGLKRQKSHSHTHQQAFQHLDEVDQVGGDDEQHGNSNTVDQKPWNQQHLKHFCNALDQNKSLIMLDLDDCKHSSAIDELLDRNQTWKRLQKYNPQLLKQKWSGEQTTSASASASKSFPLSSLSSASSSPFIATGDERQQPRGGAAGDTSGHLHKIVINSLSSSSSRKKQDPPASFPRS